MTESEKHQTAVFGGGCFWCTEAIFESLRGVLTVTPGYAGGFPSVRRPDYETVVAGDSGQAEVVKIDYDPEKIAYPDLLAVFFATHDPTTPNRQGEDVGSQYRSLILYVTDEQRKQAAAAIKDLERVGLKVVTEIKPLENFFEAEEYHRHYYAEHRQAPYCQLVIDPKLEKLRARFRGLLKSGEVLNG